MGRESKISGDNFLWGNFTRSKHHGDNSLGSNLPGGNLMEAISKEGGGGSPVMPGKACNPTSTWRNTTISFLSEIRQDAADEV